MNKLKITLGICTIVMTCGSAVGHRYPYRYGAAGAHAIAVPPTVAQQEGNSSCSYARSISTAGNDNKAWSESQLAAVYATVQEFMSELTYVKGGGYPLPPAKPSYWYDPWEGISVYGPRNNLGYHSIGNGYIKGCGLYTKSGIPYNDERDSDPLQGTECTATTNCFTYLQCQITSDKENQGVDFPELDMYMKCKSSGGDDIQWKTDSMTYYTDPSKREDKKTITTYSCLGDLHNPDAQADEKEASIMSQILIVEHEKDASNDLRYK